MGTSFWRRRATTLAAAFACVAGAANVGRAAAMPPVVPGYERLRTEAKAEPAALGEVLLGELNCLACHAAPGQQRVLTKGGPDLSDAGRRITPQYLRAYVADPHGVKPGSTMPDLFHASEAGPKEGAVDFLTHYLASLGGPMPRSTEGGDAATVELGRRLFHTVGCVACHAPEKTPATAVPSVPLPTNLASKTTVAQLTEFLIDPLKARPGGRMPAVGLTPDEATAVSVYLLREQLDKPAGAPVAADDESVRTKGVRFAYYEMDDAKTADLAKLNALTPKSQGKIDHFDLKVPGKRANNYAIKFTAVLAIPKDGKYTFFTKSDDGSRLYLDGKPVVDNDGIHPPGEKKGVADLKAGDHPIVVTFFQAANGDELTVSWQGPQIKKQEIPASVLSSAGGRPMVPTGSAAEPFAVDPQKAAMGQRMFAALGCVNCHAAGDLRPVRPAKALAELKPDAPDGCLSDHVAKGRPKYELDEPQRAALTAAIKNAAELAKPLPPKDLVTHTVAAMNCYACHKRDAAGGPTAGRAEHFVMTAEFDMGDEGRLPPQLTAVGDKLKPGAIEAIVFEGLLHIRPVLATRMPRFNPQAMPGFVEALAAADVGAGEPDAPVFGEQSAKDGRRLVGTQGLGCVNCHGVNNVKSLGMPAPDLGTAHERLRFPWFRQLLSNPQQVNPGTRMPPFWADGQVALKDVAGGTVGGQQAALWNYLLLGPSMALPAGLTPPAGMELVPSEEPIVHRTMMTGAGNRSVLVGFPEQLSVAFDADQVRLAEVWRGRFFDAQGMWAGRGGQHLAPLGTDVVPLPSGPALAVLASGNDAWPEATNKTDRNLGGAQFKGYALDKDRRPTFHYVLGGVDVHEQPVPSLKPGGASLVRRFQLKADGPADNLYFLAAQGKKIEPKAGGWTVDGKLTVAIKAPAGTAGGEPVVRDVSGEQQLLLPVRFKDGQAAFDVEMSW